MTGFRVKNEQGSEQVGSRGYSLSLASSGNITLTDISGLLSLHPVASGKVSITGTNPVIAFLPPIGKAINIERISSTGNTFTFYFRAQSSSPINFAYWIFDVSIHAVKDPTLNSAGLKVYDEFGVLTFDAADSAFRVVGYLDAGVPSPTEPGVGSLYDTTDYIAVPNGKTYAVLQSLFCWGFTKLDSGGYGSGGGGPIITDLPNPDDTRKYMYLEYYFPGAGRTADNRLYAGFIQFESGGDWYSINEPEILHVSGQTGHTVIDVTNYMGGNTTDPGVLNVSVNPPEGRAAGTAGMTTISNTVTVSASGGTAPYTITWQKVPGGAAEVVNDSALNATSFRTKVVNQAANTVYTAKWRAKVVDANGLTGSGPDVTFTHSSILVDDYITDPITPFTAFNVSSTEHDVSWDGSIRQITGINKPVTLRFERYNYTGNLSGLYLDIFTAPAPSGPWTHHGYFNAHDAGTKYLDVTGVVNGTWIAYNAHAVTTSGRREGNCTITVWNLTAPGGSVKISDVNNNNFIVDSDDNYNNADYIPGTVNWTNISGSTDNGSFSLGNNNQTITGINQSITLRATISNVSANNINLTNSRLDFWKNGVKAHDTSGVGNGYWTEATFTNGQYGTFIAQAAQSTIGVGTLSYTVTITNRSSGDTVLDTFTVNQTVDADYLPPDYTPNPISLTDQTLIIDHWEGYTSGTFFQITGINQPITIRIARGTTTDSPGRSGSRRLIIGKSTNGGASYVETPMGAASAPLDFTANNGDWFFLKGYFDTTSGRGTSSWTTTVTNATTGTVLGSCLVSGTVDNDNNYNVSDPTMNAVSMGSLGLITNDPSGYTNDQYINISGINVPINLQFTRTGVGTGMTMTPNIIRSRQYIYHSTNNWASWTEYLLTAAAGAVVNISVNNGDSIIIRGYIETSGGQASASWYTDVNNTTGGQYVGRCYLSGTVDNDDNYNVSH